MNESIKRIGRKIFYLLMSKRSAELMYWKKCFKASNFDFDNSFYRVLMLGIAGERDETFLAGKVVVDFGCGPRGSLSWAKSASERIGVDVLAESYLSLFGKCLAKHGMRYVAGTETTIPLDNEIADIVYTMNSLDHVANLNIMFGEITRILRPGGLFLGSINLNHKPTKAEPNPITETRMKELLGDRYDIVFWKVSAIPKEGYMYRPLLENQLIKPEGREAILWVRATKRNS